jgi:hypothetical protein
MHILRVTPLRSAFIGRLWIFPASHLTLLEILDLDPTSQYLYSTKSDIYLNLFVMVDLIRHLVFSWIPASAGMTACAITYDAPYS